MTRPRPARSRRGRLRRIERSLHWTLAPGLVLTIAISEYGDGLPYAAGRDAARAVTIYSLHKTLGLALLAVAIGLALSMIARRRPAPSGRVAWAPVLDRAIFWGLVTGMLVMPLSGPILHGMGPGWGYAPIWGPFGGRVPMVPEQLAASPIMREFHIQGFLLIALLSIAHVALACRLWLIRNRKNSRRIVTLRLHPLAWHLAPLLGIGMWAGLAALSIWSSG